LFSPTPDGANSPLGSITEEHFDKTFDINVKGVVFTVQKALPLLKDGSAIVINASMVSVLGQPAFSIYSATKAAVRSFARNWSVDLKDRKIRVNVVSPGFVPTAAYDYLGINAEMLESAIENVPLGRAGTPDDIAKAVVFWRRTTAATSPESSFSLTAARRRFKQSAHFGESRFYEQNKSH
jgi:NAD(P)-dependent dehydrogenase (short-subunit alcohol dehydrogenase family)